MRTNIRPVALRCSLLRCVSCYLVSCSRQPDKLKCPWAFHFQGKDPICSNGYKYLFNSCRVPKDPRDEVLVFQLMPVQSRLAQMWPGCWHGS